MFASLPKEDFATSAKLLQADESLRHVTTITTVHANSNEDKTAVVKGCHAPLSSASPRALIRDFLSAQEVAILHQIAARGIGEVGRGQDGPTIFDPDLGLILAPGGKLHRSKANETTKEELELYGEVMKRVKRTVARVHGLDASLLHHTAPTFIARLRKPASGGAHHVHDEYYHVHADKNNTAHYDYSAIIYLSAHGEDFTGGTFEFHPFVASKEEAEKRGETVLVHRPRRVSFFFEGTDAGGRRPP